MKKLKNFVYNLFGITTCVKCGKPIWRYHKDGYTLAFGGTMYKPGRYHHKCNLALFEDTI